MTNDSQTSIYDLIGDQLRQSAKPLSAADVGRRVGVSAGVARSKLRAMESGGLVTNKGGWQLRHGRR